MLGSGEPGTGPFHYAGDSVGGAVGLQLLLDHPDRVAGAALLCTGARIGTAGSWQDRAALVRAEGTKAVVPTAGAERWFGARIRRPGARACAGALLDHLARRPRTRAYALGLRGAAPAST